MKNKLLIVLAFAFIASPVFGQFTFSASPGLNLNGATFGYKFGKVVPYVGFQMLNAKFSLNTNDFGYTTPGTLIEHKTTTDIKGGVYMPSIGAKCFIVENNKLKAYLNLSIVKPFVGAKYSSETDGRVASGDSTIAANVKDVVKNIKIIGGQFGFGVEYFFDDNFSLGGEFGLSYLRGKFTHEEPGTVYDGTRNRTVTYTTEATLNLLPTYTKISLNFYFGGGKGIAAD